MMKEDNLLQVVTNLYVKPCKDHLPQYCHECPLLASKIAYNFTYNGHACPIVNNTKLPMLAYNGMWERDGEYQYQIKFFNAKDDNLITLIYFYNVKVGDARA